MSTIIIVFILIGVVLLFFGIEPYVIKSRLKNNDEYGSAKFASKREIIRDFDKEYILDIKEAGIPVFFDKKLNYIYFDRNTPHYVYLGSTGSGKSVTAVIPLCNFIATAKTKRSVFITDPKREIYNATSKMFLNHKYNVLTLDFRNPEYSNKINILEPIIKEYEEYMNYEEIYSLTKDVSHNNQSIMHLAECNRLINTIATMIMKEDVESKDPFWNNSAKNLLEGIIGLFLEEYKKGVVKREQITMTSIRKFQNSSMSSYNLEKLKRYIESKDYGDKSKDSLTSILNASEATYKSITATFGEKMSIFDDINVANITSKCDFEFDILGKEPTVIYMIVPDEDKVYYSLVSIIVGLMYKELVKCTNKQKDKRLKVQIDWILDEFANCPPLNDIESIVSVARSRGMRFNFFIQSFSQLNRVYGKDTGQIILDNCGLIFLKTNTQETAEEISKRLGKRTIKVQSVNMNNSSNSMSHGINTNLKERELLTADEIKQLHYKTIIFPTIGHPIFRDTVMYNKFKCYESGCIDRKENNILDLSDTYFTVEKLINDDKGVKKLEKEEQEEQEYEDIQRIDRSNLYIVRQKISKTIKKENYIFKYIQSETYRIYLSLIIDELLSETEKMKVLALINKEKYHIEYSESDNKTIINIHNKTLELENK